MKPISTLPLFCETMRSEAGAGPAAPTSRGSPFDPDAAIAAIGACGHLLVNTPDCILFQGCGLHALETLHGRTAPDTIIADPPFGAVTHAGHKSVLHDKLEDRSDLPYAAWTAAEVVRAVRALPPAGWLVIFSDHLLGREWYDATDAAGRVVFPPLPVITRARSVRFSGDGPSSWTDQLYVSRTKHENLWGTLPALYEDTRQPGNRVGGKSARLMRDIVEDYSPPGGWVMDFCAGYASTGVAALRTGRRFLGIEIDPAAAAVARDRLLAELSQPRLALDFE